MTRPLKLLFDENFGKPFVDKLAPLLGGFPETPVIKHVLDYFQSGSSDAEWIPRIAQERFIVISFDRGRKYGGPKLPQICAEHDVTHVLVSGKLNQRKQADKIRAIMEVWPDLAALANAPRGSRYLLRLTSTGRATLVPKQKTRRRR